VGIISFNLPATCKFDVAVVSSFSFYLFDLSISTCRPCLRSMRRGGVGAPRPLCPALHTQGVEHCTYEYSSRTCLERDRRTGTNTLAAPRPPWHGLRAQELFGLLTGTVLEAILSSAQASSQPSSGVYVGAHGASAPRVKLESEDIIRGLKDRIRTTWLLKHWLIGSPIDCLATWTDCPPCQMG